MDWKSAKDLLLEEYEPSPEIVKYYKIIYRLNDRKEKEEKEEEDTRMASKQLVSKSEKHLKLDESYSGKSVLLTPYLSLPQRNAAMLLGMSQSYLAKQWKKISNGCAWPYRRLRKIDREIFSITMWKKKQGITKIMETIPNNPMDEHIKILYLERQNLLKDYYIKIL